jgi:hypothetical protein
MVHKMHKQHKTHIIHITRIKEKGEKEKGCAFLLSGESLCLSPLSSRLWQTLNLFLDDSL